jgi:hypothetical protein
MTMIADSVPVTVGQRQHGTDPISVTGMCPSPAEMLSSWARGEPMGARLTPASTSFMASRRRSRQ